ncbi:hypothetical protein PHSY_001859 [Pseudozyma hubeiensis SY62]|uniref:Origin recognition complex subunit 1 n=1 Tax=Pseudozyma hubeiensis (strain SY62) TaxID=1305764 RepID=R9NZJ8_PSEHS|nr:hypothetical protein PHSY_001859 [Pseudozyma hubeiensis SY62]GAC94288.1 hypothetical protein PHSY_001859 [Pseudozyma hubeiensis SY62]
MPPAVAPNYSFQPLDPVESSDPAAATSHFRAFTRVARPIETVPDSEGEEVSSDDQDENHDPRSRKPSPSSSKTTLEPEDFRIGDVVYLPSSYQAPLAGVLTHLWTDASEEGKIFGVCRLLHWPEWMSTMAKKRMAGITSRHEIYYTHKATSLTKRRTKTSARSGKEGDTFEAGPSLHDYSFDVDEIIAKVHIHSSQAECSKAIKESSAALSAIQVNQPAEQPPASDANVKKKPVKTHTLYKNKSFPTHLFCERAVDPNRELFWRIDWAKVIDKGKLGAGWDLKDDSSDVATSQGQGVKDLVEQVQRDSGEVPAQTTTPRRPTRASTPSTVASASDLASTKPNRSRATGTPSSIADINDPAPKRRPGRPRKEDSLSAGVAARKRTYNRRKTNGVDTDSDAASDDSFQSGDEFEVEDNLLVKARHLDTPESSDNEGSQFSDAEIDDDDDDDDDDDFGGKTFNLTPRKRAKLAKDAPPMTPTKRRMLSTPQKMALGLASPAKAQATPRSKARLMGLKARSLPHPTLPARPPKISLLPSDQAQTLSAHDRAKRLLHVGATPDHLPCREDQYEEIMACVEDAVEEGIGGCVYVSGVPGTGKTATVREVIRALTARAERNEMNPFSFVEINGMKLADASQAYTLLWSAISGGQRTSPKTALGLLSSHFARVGAKMSGAAGGAGPGRAATVVLMDELDQLVTARQDVMYNMFNWPNTRGSRLVVIAVANTMDLPERTLNAKVASRLGMTRITFMPYTDRQLVEIVKSRLGIGSEQQTTTVGEAGEQDEAGGGCGGVLSLDAITYVSKRVSNVSGDARRMLDVCRRSIELVELKAKTSGLTIPKPVTILDMKSVLDSMVKSGKVSHILSLPLHAKILLLSLLSCLRRSGLAEAQLADVETHHHAICRMYAINFTTSPFAPVAAQDFSLTSPLATLSALGLVVCVGQGAGTARAGGFARLMLACQEDEVRLAYEHDPDERLRKML